MKRKSGFTLVELLVVVAIISILAAIVVPNVAQYIRKARATKAIAEIKGIELALEKMLMDADKSTFRHLFLSNVCYTSPQYTDAFYILLREGKNAASNMPAGISLAPGVASKLADLYMDVGNDPWGNLYEIRFWSRSMRDEIPFRTYKPAADVPPRPDPALYDFPNQEDYSGNLSSWGYPASWKKTVYIYSLGEDLASAQAGVPGFGCGALPSVGRDNYNDPNLEDEQHMGGGDDINNWDNEQSWMEFYN